MVADDPANVLVWSERTEPEDTYPNGINAAVAEHLNEDPGVVARAVSIEEEGQGVPASRLDWADALLWWGHLRHDDVTEETVDRVERAVREDGLGFVALHSAHYARPFTRLIRESGDLGGVRWEEPGEPEDVAVVAPDHPIAEGVEDFRLPRVEMFDEPFDVPEPETVVFESTFPEGGEFRSGITFSLGAGRGFYFRPGHETVRIYHQEPVPTIIANAVAWVAED